MSTLEQYDAQIARIMSKIEAIQDREFKFTCGEWPPTWEPPMTEEEVAAFEQKNGIRLPEDYRRFITTVAAGGSQPFYGLLSPGEEDSAPERPFPFELNRFPYFLYMTEEEMDAFDYDVIDNGVLPLCTEGDGMDSVLIVNSTNPEVYGTVWYYDFANDFGTVPMWDAKTGQPFHFLDWLEYWVDRTAGLNYDEYFSFADAVQLPPPPDDPNIMGRKMGWIK